MSQVTCSFCHKPEDTRSEEYNQMARSRDGVTLHKECKLLAMYPQTSLTKLIEQQTNLVEWVKNHPDWKFQW